MVTGEEGYTIGDLFVADDDDGYAGGAGSSSGGGAAVDSDSGGADDGDGEDADGNVSAGAGDGDDDGTGDDDDGSDDNDDGSDEGDGDADDDDAGDDDGGGEGDQGGDGGGNGEEGGSGTLNPETEPSSPLFAFMLFAVSGLCRQQVQQQLRAFQVASGGALGKPVQVATDVHWDKMLGGLYLKSILLGLEARRNQQGLREIGHVIVVLPDWRVFINGAICPSPLAGMFRLGSMKVLV